METTIVHQWRQQQAAALKKAKSSTTRAKSSRKKAAMANRPNAPRSATTAFENNLQVDEDDVPLTRRGGNGRPLMPRGVRRLLCLS